MSTTRRIRYVGRRNTYTFDMHMLMSGPNKRPHRVSTARELLGEPLRLQGVVHRGWLGRAQHGQRAAVFLRHDALQREPGGVQFSIVLGVVLHHRVALFYLYLFECFVVLISHFFLSC